MSHWIPSVKVLGRIISSMANNEVKVWCVGGHFNGVPGDLDKEERQYLDKACSEFKNGKALHFLEYIHKNQWNYFIEQTQGIEGDVKIWAHLPDDWSVDGKKRIKVENKLVKTAVKWVLKRSEQYPFLGHSRNVQNFNKHFMMTYGTAPDGERECVLQVLERLNVLDQSVYSRPAVTNEMQMEYPDLDYIFPIRNNNIKYRNIEGTNEALPKNNYLSNFDKSVPPQYPALKKIHCYAVLDCLPLNNDMLPMPSEKWVWPVFMGIPWIYIGTEGQIKTLRSWGFEPNDTYRSDVRGVAEQMMWLKKIFDDPDLAQKWQEKQGELIIKNREALDRVLGIINPNGDT